MQRSLYSFRTVETCLISDLRVFNWELNLALMRCREDFRAGMISEVNDLKKREMEESKEDFSFSNWFSSDSWLAKDSKALISIETLDVPFIESESKLSRKSIRWLLRARDLFWSCLSFEIEFILDYFFE